MPALSPLMTVMLRAAQPPATARGTVLIVTAGTSDLPVAEEAAVTADAMGCVADRLTDVTEGRPYRVDVYQDAGHATANRADVDLDRDEQCDEKVTFEPGGMIRVVASADDERYDLSFTWDGARWVPGR